jgi:hypothetical protein
MQLLQPISRFSHTPRPYSCTTGRAAMSAAIWEAANDRQRLITALVGVNYKIHWDGPVVAKY